MKKNYINIIIDFLEFVNPMDFSFSGKKRIVLPGRRERDAESGRWLEEALRQTKIIPEGKKKRNPFLLGGDGEKTFVSNSCESGCYYGL